MNRLLVATCLSLFASFVMADVKVLMETSEGNIHLSLDEQKAPLTVSNFVEYAESGFYNETIFHRVISGFMIQGGGLDKDLRKKNPRAPIRNEATNGLKNLRGTISMARTGDPHSATAQFFINHRDNSNLDAAGRNAGYAVFGKVVEGMDVVDKIAAKETGMKYGRRDVPLETITIHKVIIEKSEQEKPAKAAESGTSQAETSPSGSVQ